MTLGTLSRFQFGNGEAIRDVATNRNSLWFGAALVLLTGFARNYDQTYFFDSVFWLIGPLIFSFFSGGFLFLVLYTGFIKPHLSIEEPVRMSAQWRSFMGLFWFTAPIAWLYAIPVERFFSSYEAAQANIALLAIVAFWRVILMARVLNVLQEISFLRALGWVLIPASLEVLVISFLGSADRVLAGMGGMRNSPEENLVLSAVGYAFNSAFLFLAIGIVVSVWRRNENAPEPFPPLRKERVPVFALIIALVFWCAVSIFPQQEQERFFTHANLIKEEKYREAIDYLVQHSPNDFPPHRRLEPNPFEYNSFKELPRILEYLHPSDPAWIRELYFNHLSALFTHFWLRMDTKELVILFRAIESLPEGQDWVRKDPNLDRQLAHVFRYSVFETEKKEEKVLKQELVAIIQRLGVKVPDTNRPASLK